MFKTNKAKFIIGFGLLLVLIDLVFISTAFAQSRYNNIMPYWKSKAGPIQISGVTPDGKYPIYVLEGEATDITYKSGNTLYTSGQLVNMLVFVDEKDTKRYNCEFLCKDKQDRTVGINPSFKFLITKKEK